MGYDGPITSKNIHVLFAAIGFAKLKKFAEDFVKRKELAAPLRQIGNDIQADTSRSIKRP